MTFSTEKIRSAIDSRRTVAIVWAALWLLSLVALAARVPDGRLTDILSAGAPLWKTRVLTYLLHIAAITSPIIASKKEYVGIQRTKRIDQRLEAFMRKAAFIMKIGCKSHTEAVE